MEASVREFKQKIQNSVIHTDLSFSEPKFAYFDPTLEVTPHDGTQRDMASYSAGHLYTCNLVDPDLNGGEMDIKIPKEAIDKGRMAKIVSEAV